MKRIALLSIIGGILTIGTLWALGSPDLSKDSLEEKNVHLSAVPHLKMIVHPRCVN